MASFELSLDPKSSLNPLLWKGKDLQQPVHLALLRIAQAYWQYLDLDIAIEDIVITGSQANFNYTADSDIDLHIIVNYSDVNCDIEPSEFFDAKQKLWKSQHDIEIHGIPVEVYVEDSQASTKFARYSIVRSQWIDYPKLLKKTVNEHEVARLTLAWTKLISVAVKHPQTEQISKIKDMLWQYRKLGLARGGEMDTANLVFKQLRSAGITDLIRQTQKKLQDLDLSLESGSK